MSPSTAPRLAPFARFGTVFGWGVRRALSGRRFFGTAGIALLAGLGLGQIASMHDDRVFALWELLDSGLVAVGVPLVALSLVGSGFAEEVQDLTLTFHLVRPVSRKTVFVARYASGLLAAVADSQAAGSWERIKACAAEDCQWAFYDHSRNRSRAWCTMEVCGNRAKTRAYRARRRQS